MVEEQLDENTEAGMAPLTIGSQLQEARQQKKLSEIEVATELRVSKSIISHIEAEQWEKLPARTYARGYFANYVRFIGLPYEDMMAQFDLTYSVATRQPQLAKLGTMTETKRFPWLTVLAIAVIAVILWIAYTEWQQVQQQTIEPNIDQVFEPASNQLEIIPESDVETGIEP
jgi:cytoskeleton protein RodZ